MALNISPYGVTEALNAIIQAFEEDGELKVNESADFVGFYLEDGNIRMCNLVRRRWSNLYAKTRRDNRNCKNTK